MTIKKIGLIALGVVVAAGILYYGYSYTRDLLFGKALAQAKAEYEQKIAEIQARVKVNEDFYTALIGTNEKQRQDEKAAHEKEMGNIETVFGIFKSTSATELKKKGAKIDEVLAEKEKDEAALFEAKETIATLDTNNKRILSNWELSDMAKDASHKKIVDNLTLKFQTCSDWSTKLEEKLRPKPFTKVLQVAVVIAAVAVGKMI